MEHKAKIVGVALLCVAFGGSALTLGRVRGAAIIGQPLDVAIQVQMDAGDDASSLCFDADVFHADSRQDGSRVRVAVEATGQPTMVNARIQSSALVDEPVVTVYLRTGCGQKTTRRYVLLADFPSEVAAPSVPTVTPTAAPVPVPTALPSVAPALVSRPLAATGAAATAPVAKVKPVSMPKKAVSQEVVSKQLDDKPAPSPSKRTVVDDKSKTMRPVGQSRLKLDPLEALSGRVATLESSVTATPPAPSEDALRDMQRMRTLEGDVKALLALAAKNEANLVDLRARLQKAESERFPNGVMYALLALVLACLAAVGVLWARLRRVPADGRDWRNGAADEPVVAVAPPIAQSTQADVGENEARAALEAKMARTTALSELLDNASPSSEVDVSLVEMSESNFDSLMQSGAAHSAIRKPTRQPAKKGATRNLNSESVFDIRQQAEFFVSLGQTDQAVRILERQISESDEPNPLVFLDLLSIFHSLSLKVDFRQFREDFNLLFNGHVPEFARFRESGKSLESYPEVLSHISALWPTPKVLEVIETCIFRDPWDTKSESFDLAAFRELLFLHAVAQNILLESPSQPVESRAATSTTSAQPAVVPTYFTNAGNAVATSSPSPKSGVMGAQPVVDIQLPHDLDLDLSDAGIEQSALHPQAPIDSEFPPLMSETHPAGGNLMNFDLPLDSGLPGPDGRKSV